MRFASPPRHWFCIGFLLALLLSALFTIGMLGASAQVTVSDGPSLMNPARPMTTQFRYRIDVVNPTAQNNPAGAQVQGFRAADQLVIFTPTAGLGSTGTNSAGVEATVVDGVVHGLSDGNSPIPPTGFVISGHGKGAQWIRNLVKPGAIARMEDNQLQIEMTPQVYLNTVSRLIQRIETTAKAAEPSPLNNPAYLSAMSALSQCQGQLQAMASETAVTPAMQDQTKTCETLGEQAFYQAVSVQPEEFRGIWIRPSERTPEDIQRMIDRLKALGIRDVFIETYYQGKTVYPSAVMAEYGLTEQHPQFKGRDPLKMWTEAARQNDMRVHLWVQTFFAGNKKENFETYGPILNKYPQWRNLQYRSAGAGVPVPSDFEDGHYFVDPANPEVRAFLHKLILEMVTNYDVQGLNLDYIRYPLSAATKSPRYLESSWGATEAGRKGFLAYLEAGRQAQYAKDKAANPSLAPLKPLEASKSDPLLLKPTDVLWPQWIQWRKDQVSSFVQAASAEAVAIRPKLTISAVTFPAHNSEDNLKLQDWPRWVKNGWVDMLTPIGLGPTPAGMYRDSLDFLKKTQLPDSKVPVMVGVFGMYNRYDPIDFLAQIEAVHQAHMPGIMLFEASRMSEKYERALLEGPFRGAQSLPPAGN